LDLAMADASSLSTMFPTATLDQLAQIGQLQASGLNIGGAAAGAGGVGAAALPGVGGAAGAMGLGATLGMNVGTGQLAVGGLSALGNLWTAYNATELARQSFNFNKTLASDNYTNQAQAYNTNRADTLNSRGAMENLSPAATNASIAAQSVKTTV
jgi:hypothetical protein